jgi:ABC transporter substrate binding protein
MPVVGFLSAVSLAQGPHLVAGFRRGLSETGFIEDKNVAIAFRFANGQYDRLPAMATDLVVRQVNVLFAAGPPAVNAARAATSSVPIVFIVGLDPVAAGLVTKFKQPDGNASNGHLIGDWPLGQKLPGHLSTLSGEIKEPSFELAYAPSRFAKSIAHGPNCTDAWN